MMIGLGLALTSALVLTQEAEHPKFGEWEVRITTDDFDGRKNCSISQGDPTGEAYLIVSEGHVRAGRFILPETVRVRDDQGNITPTGTATFGRAWHPMIRANAARGEATFNDSYFVDTDHVALRDAEGQPVRTFDVRQYAEAEAYLHARGCPNTT